MEIRPIRSKKEHKVALAAIDALWGAKPRTDDGDRLDLLMLVVEDYEKRNYPLEPVEPLEIVSSIMQSNGYKPADLGRVIGSRSAATMVLKRERPLSLDQIRKISQAWNISADLLVGEYETTGRPVRNRRRKPKMRPARGQKVVV